MRNIEYKTSKIENYYSENRRTWSEFYPSEKEILNRVMQAVGGGASILDAGCAAGGLGYALNDQFGVLSYTGIDINKPVIEYASRQKAPQGSDFKFVHGDIADDEILPPNEMFEVVISLGCVDWNINPKETIKACWNRVKPGGYFVSSIRLTTEEGVNSIEKSYQHIIYSGVELEGNEERANYVVFNIIVALTLLKELNPLMIDLFGYWGSPSHTAVTPYSRILFSVIALKKYKNNEITEPYLRMEVPIDVLIA